MSGPDYSLDIVRTRRIIEGVMKSHASKLAAELAAYRWDKTTQAERDAVVAGLNAARAKKRAAAEKRATPLAQPIPRRSKKPSRKTS